MTAYDASISYEASVNYDGSGGVQDLTGTVSGATTTTATVVGRLGYSGTVSGSTSTSGSASGVAGVYGAVSGSTVTSGTVVGSGGDQPTPTQPSIGFDPPRRRTEPVRRIRRRGAVSGRTFTYGSANGSGLPADDENELVLLALI